MRTKLKLFLGLIFLQSIAWAQSEPPMLTLAEAIENTLRHNRTLKQANQQINQADQGVAKAWSSLYPNLSIQSRWGQKNALTDSPDNPLLTSVPQLAAISGTEDLRQFSTDIQIQQLIFDGFRTFDRIALADAKYEMARLQKNWQESQITHGVITLYFETLKLQERHKLLQKHRDDMRRELKHVQQLKANGKAIALQVLQVENQLLDIQYQLQETWAAYELSRQSLNHQMGFSLESAYYLNPLARLPAHEVTGLKALLTQAHQERSDLQTQQWQIKMAQQEQTLASHMMWPHFYLLLSYSLEHIDLLSGNPGSNNQNLFYGFLMSWQIFDGLKPLYQSQEAESRMKEAQLAYDELKSQIDFSLNQAWLQLDNLRALQVLLSHELQQLESEIKLLARQQNQGIALEKTVNDAQTRLLAKQIEYQNQVYQEQIHLSTIYFLSGMVPAIASNRTE